MTSRGKLTFKGGGGVPCAKKKTVSQVLDSISAEKETKLSLNGKRERESGETKESEVTAGQTPAQIRHKEKLKKREQELVEKAVKMSYRERIDQYNHKLSVMTEHNDLPRVSAAGNG